MMARTLLVVGFLVAVANRAEAYPQYQLSREATCTGCHVSPDGGGMLNENGFAVAEATSWKSGDSGFMYGMSKPDWLQLGGDVRGAAGLVIPGVMSAAAYPMQAELAASAETHGFSLNLVGGLRRPQEDGSAVHVLWSREHFAMWQQNPGETSGLYVRVGRLMPTFGLRLAEHVVYTQRFGGRPLYGEVYALAISYVKPGWEVHGSGFVHDSIASAVEKGDGGALYGEARIGEHAAVGLEAKYTTGDDTKAMYGGATAKVHLAGPDLLLQAEAQWIRRDLVIAAGEHYTQLAGYVMGSRPFDHGILLDVGLGHFTQDTRVKGLYRDAIDVNVHWFMTSHVEWLLTTRVELLELGGGTNGGYALAQIHYRL